MEKDKVYFAKEGITSTSAIHIATMAKEYVQTLQEELDNTTFLNGKIALIGQDFTPTQKGVASLEYMQKNLDAIVRAHSLIAWLKEAIKAKSRLTKEISLMEIDDYCTLKGIEYPTEPRREEPIDKDDVLATWSIKDRNHYLALGSKVSAYGKFLHPNGSYSNARKELKKRVNEPVIYTENGRDTIIKKYEPSIKVSTVDEKFFELQSIWRKAQAELNGYEHKIQLAIDKDKNKKNNKFAQEYADYKVLVDDLNAKMRIYKETTLQEIANYKIVIPHDLEDIYNVVTSLSK